MTCSRTSIVLGRSSCTRARDAAVVAAAPAPLGRRHAGRRRAAQGRRVAAGRRRTTPLIGYGLVVGLNKTGDRRQTIFSAQTLANMLERFGVAVAPGEIKIENVAAVLVTAQIGPYAQTGARLDVTASSIGDARSLQGGTLLPTPLRGPDGRVVALAQGPLSIGGFGAGGGGNSVLVNHLTVGRVPGGGAGAGGAAVGRRRAGDVLRLALHEPDFVSAGRVARAINMELGADAARVGRRRRRGRAGAAGSIRATLPELIARLEPLPVALDVAARVVINERTGTVVMGGDVRLGAGGRRARQPVGPHLRRSTTSRSRRRSRAGRRPWCRRPRWTWTKATRSSSRSTRARRSATSCAR